jgi:hypothetical protein
MFQNIPTFAMFHPVKVYRLETPVCFISNKPFPLFLEIHNEIGHKEVWELDVPLLEKSSIKDFLEEPFNGPYIKVCFYCSEWAGADKEELETKIIQLKNSTLITLLPIWHNKSPGRS